jgi:hypothetical protein
MAYPDSPQVVVGTRTLLVALVELEQSTQAGRSSEVQAGSPFWAATRDAAGPRRRGPGRRRLWPGSHCWSEDYARKAAEREERNSLVASCRRAKGTDMSEIPDRESTLSRGLAGLNCALVKIVDTDDRYYVLIGEPELYRDGFRLQTTDVLTLSQAEDWCRQEIARRTAADR